MYNVEINYSMKNGELYGTKLECNNIDGVIHALKVLKNQQEQSDVSFVDMQFSVYTVFDK